MEDIPVNEMDHGEEEIDINLLLVACVIADDVKKAEILLSNGATANAKDSKGNTLLAIAASAKSWDMLETLLENDAETSSSGIDCAELLHLCVNENKHKVVSLLIKNGVDANSEDSEGVRPLSAALKQENWSMVKTLIRRGANLNSAGIDSHLFLLSCVKKNILEVVEVMNKKDVDFNTLDAEGNSALSIAIEKENWPMVELLLENGADPNKAGIDCNSFLSSCVKGSRKSIVKLLLKKGVDANVVDSVGNSVLSETVRNEKWYMVETLLENGADPVSCGIDINTLFHRCVKEGENDIVYSLLKKGFDPNALDSSECSALRFALRKKRWHMAELLFKNGAKLKQGEIDGNSVLHICVNDDQASVVQWLLQTGAAEANTADASGNMPLSTAVEKQFWFTIRVLLRNGASPELAGVDLNSLLHLCVRRSKGEFIEDLLKSGADINALDVCEKTSLAVAVEMRLWHYVKILLENGADCNLADCPLLHLCIQHHKREIFDLLVEKVSNLNALDSQGHSPLQVAVKERVGYFIARLLHRGANPYSLGMKVDDFLQMCMERRMVYVFDCWLDMGGDVNEVFAGGITLWDIALEKYESTLDEEWGECCEVLMKHMLLSDFGWKKLSNITDSNLCSYLKECKSEIEELKETVLPESDVSLYLIASKKTIDDVADVLRRVDVKYHGMTDELCERIEENFKIYSQTLIFKLFRGSQRFQYLRLGELVLEQSDLSALAYSNRRKICKYLNNNQLKKLVTHFQEKVVQNDEQQQ